jgi:hypothetical protein
VKNDIPYFLQDVGLEEKLLFFIYVVEYKELYKQFFSFVVTLGVARLRLKAREIVLGDPLVSIAPAFFETPSVLHYGDDVFDPL